jgi:hypothetical protein
VTAGTRRWRALAALGAICAGLMAAGVVWQSTRSLEPRPGAPGALVVSYATPDLFARNGTVYVSRTDGSDRVEIGPGNDPSLSPDGRLVAFTRDDGAFGRVVAVAPSNGGPARSRYRAAPTPPLGVQDDHEFTLIGWLRDGELLIGRSDGLVIVDPDRSLRRLLPRIVDDGRVGSVSISPAGDRIAFEVSSSAGPDVYRASTTPPARPVRLTTGGHSMEPLAGPKGIAWFRAVTPGRDDAGLWYLPDGALQGRRLAGDPVGYPRGFDATGDHLVAGFPHDYDGRMWLVDTATGRYRTIRLRRKDVSASALSRDGRSLLGATDCLGDIDGLPPGAVVTIDVDSGTEHVIARGPCSASWTA